MWHTLKHIKQVEGETQLAEVRPDCRGDDNIPGDTVTQQYHEEEDGTICPPLQDAATKASTEIKKSLVAFLWRSNMRRHGNIVLPPRCLLLCWLPQCETLMTVAPADSMRINTVCRTAHPGGGRPVWVICWRTLSGCSSHPAVATIIISCHCPLPADGELHLLWMEERQERRE